MRVLLSVYGSRSNVESVVGLAVPFRTTGAKVQA
jgi:hypothetical protein